MKIRLEEIPEGGLSLDLTEEGEALEALAGELDFSFLSPVKARLELTKADGGVYVTGEIDARLRQSCSRCLNEFPEEIRSNVSMFFSSRGEEDKEKELTTADMEVNLLKEPELDTTEIILGQLSLDVPMQPLCKVDCPGLCPRCGKDLSEGPCGCKEEEKVDPRLAALKDFKVK